MKKALLAFKNKFDVPDGLAFKSVSGALENLKANTFVCGRVGDVLPFQFYSKGGAWKWRI